MKLENTDDDLEKQARAEVAAILGQSVPIQASTLAEAIAEAERVSDGHKQFVGVVQRSADQGTGGHWNFQKCETFLDEGPLPPPSMKIDNFSHEGTLSQPSSGLTDL